MAFDDFIKIEESIINNKAWSLVTPGTGVVVVGLVYNIDLHSLVFVEQWRVGAGIKLLEAPAGFVEKGESRDNTIVREIEEETGYRVRNENLHFIDSMYTSPGWCSEIMYAFYAVVNNGDKIGLGGGLQNEGESIKVVHVPLDCIEQYAYRFMDCKTNFLVNWFRYSNMTKV